MTQVVAVHNEKSSGTSDADVEKLIAPLQKQVEEFSQSWGRDCELQFVASSHRPPSRAWTIAILNNSDQAGALGYHDLTPSGLPLGKVFAGTDRQYGETLSVTLSHELLEMLGDPFIDLTAQGPDGKFYAYEACDAVEADALGYTIDGVLVSDYVTPAWFGRGAGPYDRQKKVSRPLELASGGYIGVFDPSSGQGWTQVTAEKAAVMELPQGGHLPLTSLNLSAVEARRVAVGWPRVGSRRERRFRRAAGGRWLASTYETE